MEPHDKHQLLDKIEEVADDTPKGRALKEAVEDIDRRLKDAEARRPAQDK